MADHQNFESLDVGVCVHDRTERITLANQALHQMLGVAPGVLLGLAREDIELVALDGSELPPDLRPVSLALRGGVPVRDRVVGLRHRGHAHRAWVRLSCVPELDATGQVVQVVSTVIDLTGTMEDHARRVRELQDAVEASDLRYRAVIEAMSEGVVVHAADGHILAANPAATRILGLTLDQLTGRSPLDPSWALVRADGSPLPGDEIPSEITRRTGEPRHDVQLGVMRPTGERRWLSVTTMPIRPEADESVVVTITDVTESRQMAESMRRRQRLEAIGDLTAGIAHNFNNLLAVIIPSVELALVDAPPTVRAPLSDAHAAARAGAELVKQLMRVVRRDVHEIREVTEVGRLVDEVVGICRRTFDRRIQIESRGHETAHVRCGAADLQQVLLNLCINARDAMEATASPRLLVETSIDAEAEVVEIRISDNGSGMTEEVERRLGDPFFTTKAPGKGTGLGIATALGTVRDAGGTLSWTSRHGQGTTFRIRLPIASENAPVRSASPEDQPPLLPASRVLVVDDEPMVRNVLVQMLSQLGLDVTSAGSGAQALELVRTATMPFAAVLLDLSMPGMSGAHVLAELRALQPTLPVIMLTGYLSTDVSVVGATAVLTKPLGADELQATLQRVLDAHR